MKHKNHKKSVHQHIEQALRHRLGIAIVSGLMFIAAASFDGRVRGMMQEAYVHGWGWIGTYLHHEHPMHSHHSYGFARITTISGPGPN